MSKKPETSTKNPTLQKTKSVGEITEYVLTSNDLRVLYVPRPGTGIITTNIVYKIGSRDEARGETGIAHMLEHMLFKPTRQDIARKSDSGAMQFEREIGITLNANTWRDRTSYYFSYPKEHFRRALQIEAERMRDVLLTDKEFIPERTNVLSEFDMYAGDEQFMLSVQMASLAFHSHPYGHETIGFREDIEDYTVEKLQRYYDTYYTPHNATLIVVGDVSEASMKTEVITQFGTLKNPHALPPRLVIREPKQEGERSVTISRPSPTQVYAVGVRHNGFPTKGWFETMVIFDMLAGGDDSILQKKLIDTGKATKIDTSLEPSYEGNLGILFITLTAKSTHEKMHAELRKIISELTPTVMKGYLQKTLAKVLMSEAVTRENSLGYTGELVEYVSAGAWEQFFDSERILKSITPSDIHTRLTQLFAQDQIITGYFKGTK